MAKYVPKAKPKAKTSFPGTAIGSAPWQRTYGTSLTGMEYIDEMKVVASKAEDDWGIGRLRMLVPLELREKFDRQRYLTNQAIWHGDLEDVKAQTKRMIVAYQKLDAVAQASGASRKPVEQWEAVLGDGTLLVVVRTPEEAHRVENDGRRKVIWSMDEVAMVVEQQQAVLLAKKLFDGAEVLKVDRPQKDPLDVFVTSLPGLDDDVSDIKMFNPIMG